MKIGMTIEVNLRKAKDRMWSVKSVKVKAKKNNWSDYCQVLKKISIRWKNYWRQPIDPHHLLGCFQYRETYGAGCGNSCTEGAGSFRRAPVRKAVHPWHGNGDQWREARSDWWMRGPMCSKETEKSLYDSAYPYHCDRRRNRKEWYGWPEVRRDWNTHCGGSPGNKEIIWLKTLN